MNSNLPETDHHIIISADSHCGADLRGYKPYLEKKFHSDFEEWADAVAGRSTYRINIDEVVSNVQILESIINSAEKNEIIKITD